MNIPGVWFCPVADGRGQNLLGLGVERETLVQRFQTQFVARIGEHRAAQVTVATIADDGDDGSS